VQELFITNATTPCSNLRFVSSGAVQHRVGLAKLQERCIMAPTYQMQQHPMAICVSFHQALSNNVRALEKPQERCILHNAFFITKVTLYGHLRSVPSGAVQHYVGPGKAAGVCILHNGFFISKLTLYGHLRSVSSGAVQHRVGPGKAAGAAQRRLDASLLAGRFLLWVFFFGVCRPVRHSSARSS